MKGQLIWWEREVDGGEWEKQERPWCFVSGIANRRAVEQAVLNFIRADRARRCLKQGCRVDFAHIVCVQEQEFLSYA